MSFSLHDPIIGPSRGSASHVKAYAKTNGAANLDFTEDYIDEVYRLCAPDTMPDAAVVVAQSVHETTESGRPWFSYWWRQRGNPAGMGITGDPDENAKSPTFTSGAQAAQAHVAHLLLYATGQIGRGGLTSAADPRYPAYVKKYGNTVQAETIAGLTGKWGVDAEYGEKVVVRGDEVFPDLPDPEPTGDVVFGRVPHPPFEIRDIPSSVNTAWRDYGARTIRGIVWHRSLGSHNGNDGYFRGEGRNRALTDYGIGVAAQDGANLAGSIYRWNDPRGRRSPFANGSVDEPYGDGKKFIDRYGVTAVNRDLVSVEISGFQNTPLDPKSREAIAWLTAYYADQYRVSWETFPLIPSEGNRSFVLWHQEITIGSGKECPFKVVMDETTALIARAKQILKQWQAVAPDPDPEPEPEPEPDEKPDLPSGMSMGVVEGLFNPNKVAHPETGKVFSFNYKGKVSKAWFDQAVASIPEGEDWEAGNWVPLVAVIKRGDGRLIFEFTDFIYETDD